MISHGGGWPVMDLAARIDHTLLKAEATRPQIYRLVAEALEHGFASVCVNGAFIGDVVRKLHGSPVKTCGVAGFPLGANKTTIKSIEVAAAAKDGADEVDFVAYQPHLLNKDLSSAKAEFLEVIKAVRSVNPHVLVKVIIETAVLMQGVAMPEAELRIACACQAARESGCDFVKTSTGCHAAGGATIAAVKLIKKYAGGLQVKAAGGIRSYDDAMAMVDAGADRIGCSASVAVVRHANS